MIYLKLQRGVSGEDLESIGYKVTLLPKKARTKKVKASRVRKEKRRMQTKKERLARRALAKRLYRVRQKEWLGIVAMRAIWKAKRQRTKARRRECEGTAEVGCAVQGVRAEVPCVSDAGLRPSGDGVLPGMQESRGGG